MKNAHASRARISRLRRSCARLDKTAMLRRLHGELLSVCSEQILRHQYGISVAESQRYPSSRNVPQRRGAKKTVCFLRRPHSIIAKYVSCRPSKLRESLKQAVRVNVGQVRPLVRYFSILVKKNVSIMSFFTLISLLRHDRQCR